LFALPSLTTMTLVNFNYKKYKYALIVSSLHM
jgi:hypothetical protein